MAPPVRTTRAQWIERGLASLAGSGPDAVRVEAIAKSLGVTKGGFYGHFADRADFLTQLLDTWEREATDDVLERVEREGGNARTKVRKAAVLTLSEHRLLPIDLAVRDWARRDPLVAERLRRVDNRRMEYLRSQFADLHPGEDPNVIEARCLLAFSLLLADHLIAADHGEGTRAQVVERAATLLEGDSATSL